MKHNKLNNYLVGVKNRSVPASLQKPAIPCFCYAAEAGANAAGHAFFKGKLAAGPEFKGKFLDRSQKWLRAAGQCEAFLLGAVAHPFLD